MTDLLSELEEAVSLLDTLNPHADDACWQFIVNHHAEIAAAVRDAKALREQLRTTAAVAVTALFTEHPDDVLERFTAPELESIVDLTASLKDKRVEAIYREAWDTAMRAGEGEG